jgi:2-hydroxychromene-2-carboxylate isomerase
MSRAIDYYFSLVSPWAYIGHAPFMEMARRHGLAVNYKPVFLGRVFAETGGLPLAQRHPARQRYRLVELQRWRDRRGLSFNIQPKFWPFDVTLADRFVVAIQAKHGVPIRSFRRPSRRSGKRSAISPIPS